MVYRLWSPARVGGAGWIKYVFIVVHRLWNPARVGGAEGKKYAYITYCIPSIKCCGHYLFHQDIGSDYSREAFI